MRFTGLASLLLALACSSVTYADQSLVLDLPSQHPEAAASSAPPKPSKAAARRGAPTRMAHPPSRHAEARATRSERVVGRLGVASRAVGIHVGRSAQLRTLANVRPGTYIALTGESGGWYGVLMADRTTGWVPKAAVQVLDYQVMSPDPPAQPPAAANSSAPNLQNALLTTGQRSILETAYRYIGVPYRWGGTSPNGMDCSAFVKRCFSTLGINLPRTAHEQAQCGMPVSADQLQPADRLYFASSDGRITHTGIYIGNGYFIHSSSSRGGVAVSQLSEALYRRMYCGARR